LFARWPWSARSGKPLKAARASRWASSGAICVEPCAGSELVVHRRRLRDRSGDRWRRHNEPVHNARRTIGPLRGLHVANADDLVPVLYFHQTGDNNTSGAMAQVDIRTRLGAGAGSAAEPADIRSHRGVRPASLGSWLAELDRSRAVDRNWSELVGRDAPGACSSWRLTGDGLGVAPGLWLSAGHCRLWFCSPSPWVLWRCEVSRRLEEGGTSGPAM
jgi:hypothetical protein